MSHWNFRWHLKSNLTLPLEQCGRDIYAESITWRLGTSNPLGQFQLFWLHGILSPLSSLICIWPRFEHHCLLLSPQHTPYSIAHPEISIPNQLSGIADRATESCLSVCSFPLVEFSSHYEKTSYLPIVELPREVDRFRQTLQGRKELARFIFSATNHPCESVNRYIAEGCSCAIAIVSVRSCS